MRRTTTLVAALLAIVAAAASPPTATPRASRPARIRGTVVGPTEPARPGVTVTIQSPALQGVRTSVTAGDGSYMFRPAAGRTIRDDLRDCVLRTGQAHDRCAPRPVGRAEHHAGRRGAHRASPGRRRDRPRRSSTRPSAPTSSRTRLSRSRRRARLQGIATAGARPDREHAERRPGRHQRRASRSTTCSWSTASTSTTTCSATPQNLFIEDAIEETQVLTSGITAEYGRFTGGVVNAVTKSGGNNFSGQLADELRRTRPGRRQTPFERCDPAVTCRDLQPGDAAARRAAVHPRGHASAGRSCRDRLWFFGAGRLSETTDATPLPQTGLPNTLTDRQQARRDQVHRARRRRTTRSRVAI